MRTACIVSGEVTSERLAQLMAENCGTMASLTGEARGLVQVLSGRYADGQANDGLYLSAFVVDEPYRRQRVTSGDTSIDRPCLAIGWLVQPDAFREMWSKESFVTGGLLPRFLSCRTRAPMQRVEIERKSFPQGLATWYHETLCGLLAAYRMNAGGLLVAKATTEARRIIIEYTNRTADRSAAGWFSTKGAPFAARWGEIAWKLALVFHAADHGAKAHTVEVSADTARCAVALVSWFALQQLNLLGETEEAEAADQSMKLLNFVIKWKRVTARMVAKAGICDTSEEAVALLGDLVKQGLLESRDHVGRGTPTRYYSQPTIGQQRR